MAYFKNGDAALAKQSLTQALQSGQDFPGRSNEDRSGRMRRQGAYDCLCKQVQVDELRGILRRAFHISQLEPEHCELQRYPGDGAFQGILSRSP